MNILLSLSCLFLHLLRKYRNYTIAWYENTVFVMADNPSSDGFSEADKLKGKSWYIYNSDVPAL